MIKRLHYIKEHYSGNAEKACLLSFKTNYPDFELIAWQPGSSPLKILYDDGGLFIGPGILSLERIPDSFLQKPFLVFDNSFETTNINFNIVIISINLFN